MQLPITEEKANEYAKRIAFVRMPTLLYGPPGIVRTMIARRVVNHMPPMTPAESERQTSLYRAAGLWREDLPMVKRPFRAPHNSISLESLVGLKQRKVSGDKIYGIGEMALAAGGVLYLDELEQFPKRHIEEAFNRADEGMFKSYLLIAGMAPCPCGWRGSQKRACSCSQELFSMYWKRMQPFVDRFRYRIDLY